MNCKILSKYIEKETIRGILFFIKDEDDEKQIEKFGTAELYQQATLCYLAFYETLDAQIRLSNIDTVIKVSIKDFHHDYQENIQSLYQSLDPLSVASILQIVEDFITDTVTKRYERIIHQ